MSGGLEQIVVLLSVIVLAAIALFDRLPNKGGRFHIGGLRFSLRFDDFVERLFPVDSLHLATVPAAASTRFPCGVSLAGRVGCGFLPCEFVVIELPVSPMFRRVRNFRMRMFDRRASRMRSMLRMASHLIRRMLHSTAASIFDRSDRCSPL